MILKFSGEDTKENEGQKNEVFENVLHFSNIDKLNQKQEN